MDNPYAPPRESSTTIEGHDTIGIVRTIALGVLILAAMFGILIITAWL